MHAPAEQLFFTGNRHLAARDYALAKACFREAVTIAPGLGEAHANLAWLLEKEDACDEAEACYRRALTLNPSSTRIHLNYGAFLAGLKRFPEAEAIYVRALELDPASAPVWSNIGALYVQMARFEEAEACCRMSVRLDAGYAKARINLAYLCLREGRFEEGWQHYEWRTWQCPLAHRVDASRWTGEPLEGKAILIGHEGGYGDMIQFCRFAGLLKHRGAARITLICHPALQTLFASLAGVDEVLSYDDPLPRSGWDFWASLMSLPYRFGTRVDTVPAALPYLRAEAGAVARWRAELPAEGVLVGIVWKGNPKFENDRDRSIPSLALLEPLAGMAGVGFVSLQKGAGEDEAVEMRDAFELVHETSDIESFADTAAIVANLDLVIAVDTAVAHLAGAMGKPCWILLPDHMTDWRWLAGREDSPWYPGAARLFRQTTRGDWASVIAEVRVALAQFVRERKPGLDTCGMGETPARARLRYTAAG